MLDNFDYIIAKAIMILEKDPSISDIIKKLMQEIKARAIANIITECNDNCKTLYDVLGNSYPHSYKYLFNDNALLSWFDYDSDKDDYVLKQETKKFL